MFVESGSAIYRLEAIFRARDHGLARVTTGQVRNCGFVLKVDPSVEFPDDLHVLVRPANGWTGGMYRTKAEQIAALAEIVYLPKSTASAQ